ncbi:hypothetical protein ACFL96_01285 [Thermoproteota archaeon]
MIKKLSSFKSYDIDIKQIIQFLIKDIRLGTKDSLGRVASELQRYPQLKISLLPELLTKTTQSEWNKSDLNLAQEIEILKEQIISDLKEVVC